MKCLLVQPSISSSMQVFIYRLFRPSLSKKSFPVGRVGKKTASREVGNFFFFPNFNFHKLECTVGEVKKKFVF